MADLEKVTEGFITVKKQGNLCKQSLLTKRPVGTLCPLGYSHV